MAGLQRKHIAGLAVLAFIAGCGGGGGSSVKLVPVSGVVTYKSAPLAGATVTFMPEKGPLAMGVTDLSGAFKLNSGATPGCAVGPAKVAVSVSAPGESGGSTSVPAMTPGVAQTPEQLAEMSKKMAQGTMDHQQKSTKAKSLIPDKYQQPATSGLSYTVEDDSSKNNFKIDLVD